MSRPGFKSEPQRLEAAILAQLKSARVQLVPLPVVFVAKVVILGKRLRTYRRSQMLKLCWFRSGRFQSGRARLS